MSTTTTTSGAIEAFPACGIYYDVPFGIYRQWRAVNHSSLAPLRKSPAHYKAALDHPRPPSDARRLGSLIHAGQLEPLSLAQRYVVEPADLYAGVTKEDGTATSVPARTSQGRARKAEFMRGNADKEIVTQDQYDTMLGVCRSIAASAAAQYFLGDVKTEVSLVWRDMPTGLLCKGRVDVLNEALLLLPDLKTTDDASDYSRAIWKYAIDRQLAFYCDGLMALTGKYFKPILIVAETVKPYCIRKAPLGLASLDEGRREYRTLLATVAECRRTDTWPGYPDPEQWERPPWAFAPLELTRGGKPIT